MEFFRVLLLLVQLILIVQGHLDCPQECRCVNADVGGLTASCEHLSENLTFSNNIHHLIVTNTLPGSQPIKLKNNFFKTVDLGELQSISLVNSRLMNIDSHAFSGLSNLLKVDVSNNLILRIHPDTFKDNTLLQQLSLSGNKLLLPDSTVGTNYILKSDSLTDLDLSECGLKQITKDTFSELPALRSLNLGFNELHFLSQELFDKLESLEEMNLASNGISDITESLFLNLEDLTKLNLSNNSISKFDEVEIESLTELDLSYNLFESLEATTLGGVFDIANINFSHNRIEKIDEDTFAELDKLRYLDLSFNKIKGPLSKSLLDATVAIETLLLDNNPNLQYFVKFSGVFKNLYTVGLSFCGLHELSEDSFENFQILSTLDLSNNYLKNLKPGTFSKLSKLNNLDLSYNQLTSLPNNLFEGNMDLRKLIIKGNNLHSLSPKLFQPTVHLTYLDASECHLKFLWSSHESTLTEGYRILNQLRFFNLESNDIHTFYGHNFNSLINLKTLIISKNPLVCDQPFALLIEWLITHKVRPDHYIGITSSDIIQEHAELHWEDILSKVCSTEDNKVIRKQQPVDSVPVSPIDIIPDNKMKGNFVDKRFDNLKSAEIEQDIYVKTVPDVEFTSNFGLVPAVTQHGESNNITENEYSWITPMFFVLVFGISILLALFNLAALLMYRTGRNYRVAGYRSTFITPFTGGIKIRRDAGTFYHKLYEECSVPNNVPIVKSPDNFSKPSKKNTIVISGATKGEDMV